MHRSFIAAISKIDAIEGGQLFIHGQAVPISRSLREQVIENVVVKSLWDKKG